jgi:hypothetical protein
MTNEFFAQINGTLYVRFAAFRAAGWKEMAIKIANHRNGPHWLMIDDPADARRPLVQYDTLRPAHKEKLNRHFAPDVPTWYAKAPIKALVVKDEKAEEHYRRYRYNENTAPARGCTATIPPRCRVAQYAGQVRYRYPVCAPRTGH